MNEELRAQLPNGTLKVLSCTAHTFGEFAGNLDVAVDCEPAVARQAIQHLQARIPGEQPLIAIAHGKTPQGIELVYHAVSVADSSSAPPAVEFLWANRELGRMACSTEGGGQAVEQTFELISAEKARAQVGHRRRDALPIGECGSHEQALAMAADAAEQIKIPILDTGKRWV